MTKPLTWGNAMARGRDDLLVLCGRCHIAIPRRELPGRFFDTCPQCGGCINIANRATPEEIGTQTRIIDLRDYRIAHCPVQ